jgi:hypothetical protein
MTRRLTLSGSRSEMGLISDPAEPESPPPSWTPAKQDFWKKPSKWQICMPRLRLVAKIMATLIGFILLVKIMGQQPPPPPPPPTPPPEPPKPPTEAEMIEASKRQDWIWKDFATYVKQGTLL